MKRLCVKKKRKRQKRCYRNGRRKDRRHDYDEMVLKEGETDELWKDEHIHRDHRCHANQGQ